MTLRATWETFWRSTASAWLPAWLPLVVTLSICKDITLSMFKSASSSQHQKRLFTELPTNYRRKQHWTLWQLEINFSQLGSAAALCRWFGQINNFCVAHFLSTLCAKYCKNRSTYIDVTVKWTLYLYMTDFCTSEMAEIDCPGIKIQQLDRLISD